MFYPICRKKRRDTLFLTIHHTPVAKSGWKNKIIHNLLAFLRCKKVIIIFLIKSILNLTYSYNIIYFKIFGHGQRESVTLFIRSQVQFPLEGLDRLKLLKTWETKRVVKLRYLTRKALSTTRVLLEKIRNFYIPLISKTSWVNINQSLLYINK